LYLTGTGERSSLPKTAIGEACGLRSGVASCHVRAGVAAVAASTAATIAVLAPTPRDLPAVITPVILTPVILTPVILTLANPWPSSPTVPSGCATLSQEIITNF
jgi:hypothetical protein